ncbi:hypothetical protein XfCFBP8356_012425 [Xylella fastidiosa subsp. sandyi]|nr:hypothetical protein [Xylella fastidiosa]WNY19045.1 hypothetical protein RO839_11475 [Xylella fastidiosa]WNY21334.1 hypothetical protein RO838_11490 [Xylella fastidiosa]
MSCNTVVARSWESSSIELVCLSVQLAFSALLMLVAESLLQCGCGG